MIKQGSDKNVSDFGIHLSGQVQLLDASFQG